MGTLNKLWKGVSRTVQNIFNPAKLRVSNQSANQSNKIEIEKKTNSKSFRMKKKSNNKPRKTLESFRFGNYQPVRYFLMLIVLSGVMKAQDNPYEIMYGPERHLITRALMFEWDLYSQECYNDSTLECFESYVKSTVWFDSGVSIIKSADSLYYVPCGHSIDPGFNSRYRGTTSRWAHRQPTLQGFMAFIRQRSIR